MAGYDAPNRVYETMTRFTFMHWTVRVWSTAKEAQAIDPEIQKQIVHLRYIGGVWTAENLLEKVSAWPGVAAVEVLDINGNGPLVYPNWS